MCIRDRMLATCQSPGACALGAAPQLRRLPIAFGSASAIGTSPIRPWSAPIMRNRGGSLNVLWTKGHATDAQRRN
eukprot:972923-Pyramimonas_sp.AAC.1